MSSVAATLMLDAGESRLRPRFTIGEAVCVKDGTADPDFRGMWLDGWVGEIVEVDGTASPAEYRVQWDESTVARMSVECRNRCAMADLAFDQMWLSEADLDVEPL